jgi:hypothetical protein
MERRIYRRSRAAGRTAGGLTGRRQRRSPTTPAALGLHSHHMVRQASVGKIVGAAMMIRTPRQPVDLAVTTKDVRLRMERVLANLEPITQQRDPILADPRAVWLDVTLSIVELESVTILMKRAWWP